MQHLKYMRVKYKYIPEDIKTKYNIEQIVTKDDWVYISKFKKECQDFNRLLYLPINILKIPWNLTDTL